MAEIEVNKNWYALKVFYNRVFSVAEVLQKEGVRSYVPTIVKETTVGGRIIRRRQPAVASLMFAYESPTYLKELQARLQNSTPFMLYYNRAERRPAPISDHEMNIFMLVTSAGEQSLEYLADDIAQFEKGDRVRVIGGAFEGAEGYIHRIKGDRRLVVRIEGVVAVATSYIPNSFLEKI